MIYLLLLTLHSTYYKGISASAYFNQKVKETDPTGEIYQGLTDRCPSGIWYLKRERPITIKEQFKELVTNG